MIHVLWERGWIDPSKNVRDYSVNGKKVKKGNDSIIPGSNLKQLIDDLPDFREGLTLLQFRAKQLGVELRCSPKYHPEIAGDAIEFCWAGSKNAYRRHKIQEKRTKAKFIELVNECKKKLTKQNKVRIFGRRLRRYVLAYYALAKEKEEQDITDAAMQHENISNHFHIPEMSCSLVERLVKKWKSHRNIADSFRKEVYEFRAPDDARLKSVFLSRAVHLCLFNLLYFYWLRAHSIPVIRSGYMSSSKKQPYSLHGD